MSSGASTARQTATGETNRKLAFGVFGAPIAWAVNETVNAGIVGQSCSPRGVVPGGVEWAATIVTLCAAIVAAAAVVVALQEFRRASNAGVARAEGWGRVEFVAQFGVLLSSLLLLNIVFFGLVPWIVQRCTGAA